MVNHFWQSVDDIFKDVFVTKVIVWCLMINFHLSVFQNYGSLTRVNWLNVAPNMTNPISLNKKQP